MRLLALCLMTNHVHSIAARRVKISVERLAQTGLNGTCEAERAGAINPPNA